MVSKKDFDFGDLVWAKMKGFPFWPGEIANPPTHAKSAKKAQHYVFFFGSKNYAWILDENIVHHSEKMLESASTKKKSTVLKTAIEEISEKASKAAKSPIKEKKCPEASTSGAEKKITKEEKIKTRKVIKKTVLKRGGTSEESSNEIIPPPKSRKTEDFSELINNTPPNLTYDPVAVSKASDKQCDSSLPSEEQSNALASPAKMTWHDYFKLEPGPPLNVFEPHASVIAKNVIPNDKKLGFIGLGMMGQRLVKNLITTRHKVMIWNRTVEKCEDFAKAGALVAESPADLVEKCDVIFTCLSDSEASKAVMYGSCGILEGLEKCSTGTKAFIEMTTMDPESALTLSEAITKRGGKYLEAPISGSTKMAEDGSLFILTAGDVEIFSGCQSCFFALADTAYFLSHVVGDGAKMNLIISILFGISYAALAEAMSLIERLKLSEENFLEILELGPLNSPLILEKGKSIMSRYFATDSTLKYRQRDLNLALSFASSCEQPLPVTAAANELYKHARILQYSEHDVSALFLGTSC